MKVLWSMIVCLILTTRIAGAQVPDSVKYRVTATIDSTSPTGVYIPTDLPDSFRELRRMLHPAFIAEFRADSQKVIEHHFGLGLWMRNNWGLWGGSRLAQAFNRLGIQHPDDMSGIILQSFWRELNGQPIRLEDQIARYQAYWQQQSGAKPPPQDTTRPHDRRPKLTCVATDGTRAASL